MRSTDKPGSDMGPAAGPRRRRARLPRLLRGVLGAALGVIAFYLIAGNVLLNTAFGPELVNRKPEKFTLAWSGGVTWWPGFVTLWNVQANGHVRRVVWSAQAARARGRIALLPLLSRELRVVWIEAGEVTGSADRSADDMLPPPSHADGWTLRFERIATDSLRQARIGAFDIQTEGSAEFAFLKQLRGGPMQVMPSHVLLRDTRIRSQDNEWLSAGTIEASLAIDRHRREDAAGLAKLGLADLVLRIGADLPALAVDLDDEGKWRGRIDPAGTRGRLEATLSMRHGVLDQGGMLEARFPLAATHADVHIDEEARVLLAIEGDGMHLTAHLPPPPEGRGLIDADLRFSGRKIPFPADPKALLARVGGHLDLEWHFGSLDWLGPLLVRVPWLTLKGSGGMAAQLRIADGRIAEGSHVVIPAVDVVAQVAAHRFHGQARADARLSGDRVRLGLVVERFEAAAEAAPDKTLVRGSDLRIDLESSADLHQLRESLRGHLRFANAEVPDLRAVNDYLPQRALSLLGGSTRLGGDLRIDAEGRVSTGRVDLAVKGARARFAAIELSGDLDLDARIGGTDVKTRHFDLDNTTLRLRNVRVVDDGHTAGERWWANLRLARGRIDGFKPLVVDARTEIEMENVGLLLALFARHRDYPGWALRMVDAGTLRASGKMRVQDEVLVFDRVEASNDRFSVKARLRVVDAKPSGDLLLSWRALGLGLELERGEHKFHLLGAKQWYAERPELLPTP